MGTANYRDAENVFANVSASSAEEAADGKV